MAKRNFNALVHGRSANIDGHGSRQWSFDCGALLTGRSGDAMGRPFKARRELGEDLLAAMNGLASSTRWTRGTFQALFQDIIYLFIALDAIESASPYIFSGGAENLSGEAWHLFTLYLDATHDLSRVSIIYSQVRRVVIKSVHLKCGELPPHFILPANSFVQDKGISRWDREDDLEDDHLKAIAKVLLADLTITSKRLAANRSLIPAEFSKAPIDGFPDDIGTPNSSDARYGNGVEIDTRNQYHSLWGYLCGPNAYLPQTAVFTTEGILCFDVHKRNVIAQSLVGGRRQRGPGLRPGSVPAKIAILKRLERGPLESSNYGAQETGLSFSVFRANARALEREGAITRVVSGRKSGMFHAISESSEAKCRYEAYIQLRSAPRVGQPDLHALLHVSLPRKAELQSALALLLMRTGFNLSTVLSIRIGDWHRPHPIHRGIIEEIYARKSRAGGKLQYAHSNTTKRFHAYDLIRRVIAWTEPLRAMVREKIRLIDCAIAIQPNARNKLEQLRERRRLSEISSRIWLVIQVDGRITEISDIRWGDFRKQLGNSGLLQKDGKPIPFGQNLTRRAWAIFNYEKSGSNLLLTKLALGHSDISSIIRYIARGKERNVNRIKWVGMQSAIIKLFSSGDLATPGAVRTMLGERGLSPAEVERIQDFNSLTRHGVLCANPEAPDAHIDPKHRPGRICKTQNCLNGCSKAYATLETARYLARAIIELRHRRGSMSVIAWRESDYWLDLEAAERLFESYLRPVRDSAMRAARTKAATAFFGVPSTTVKEEARSGSDWQPSIAATQGTREVDA